MTAKMAQRLRAIAAAPGQVMEFSQPNWNAGTDKALRRRGLVWFERVMGWWRVGLTDAGRQRSNDGRGT